MNFINKKNMKTKLFLIMFATAIFAVSCNSKKEEAEHSGEHEELPANVVEMNDAQYNAAGIELGNVEYKELSSVLTVNGMVSVSPQNLVSVSAIMGGYVKSTSLVQGSPVIQGQVIAVIENPDFIELQQNYLESKSKLDYAETEFNRQKELYKENVNSAKSYELAISEYKTLQSLVAALEQKLKLIGISVKNLTVDKISASVPVYSPISGYVKTINVNIGKYVNPTDVIAEIVNTKNMTLELTVFEKDIDKVHIGQKLDFILPAKPDVKMSAFIYQMGKTINDDKTVKIYCTVEKGNKNLLPGMYVSATIETQSDSVTALPIESVLTFEDKNYIFIFSEKKKEGEIYVTLFEALEIEKGVTENGYIQVSLPEKYDLLKTKIVIKGAYNLLSALKNAGDMAC
jgi:cobalt-zinc-cadmium efflux system membrane fusion protein